jgi:hypothetical protein
MPMPRDPNAPWRVRLAFLSLFVVFAAGAYFARDLGRLRDSMAVRESPTTRQGAADAKPTTQAVNRPAQDKSQEKFQDKSQDRSQPLLAMAAKAADDTHAAMDNLSNEIAPPGVAKRIDFGTASLADLEALRRDLKTAEANAATFLPRYVALLKAERDSVEQFARANVDKTAAGRFLASLDKRNAEITDFTSRMLSARADYYRAYDNYVAFLAREWGAYKVDKGEFLFPLQYTYGRYNVVAGAMTAAANHVIELDREGKALLTSQPEQPTQSVGGR